MSRFTQFFRKTNKKTPQTTHWVPGINSVEKGKNAFKGWCGEWGDVTPSYKIKLKFSEEALRCFQSYRMSIYFGLSKNNMIRMLTW